MINQPAPLKKYGQHFLQDANIAEKIVRLANLPANSKVIEIGPGRGILTRAILANSDATLLAIEKDRNLAPLLEPLLTQYPERLNILFQDALAWQPQDDEKMKDEKLDVIANLPYNVGSQLLVNFCQQHVHYRQMVLMFQKEVAQRLVAKPGTADFGRLSILVQTVATPDILFTLSPAAFFPPPKVWSAVVRLRVKTEKLPCDIVALGNLTNILFQQRRKQLHHGLAKIIGGDTSKAKSIMDDIGIVEKSRAEDLSLASFWAMTNMLESYLKK